MASKNLFFVHKALLVSSNSKSSPKDTTPFSLSALNELISSLCTAIQLTIKFPSFSIPHCKNEKKDSSIKQELNKNADVVPNFTCKNKVKE